MKSEKVIRFTGITKLNLPSSWVIEGILKKNLKDVIVLGYEQDGSEYFASSLADGGDVLWLLERCKQELMGGE